MINHWFHLYIPPVSGLVFRRPGLIGLTWLTKQKAKKSWLLGNRNSKLHVGIVQCPCEGTSIIQNIFEDKVHIVPKSLLKHCICPFYKAFNDKWETRAKNWNVIRQLWAEINWNMNKNPFFWFWILLFEIKILISNLDYPLYAWNI